MSEKHTNGINDLLALFEDTLSPSDVLAAKLIAQVSTSITKERIKLHMSQQEFSEHIHASQSLISRWEHGEYNFSLKKIAEIASCLNLDVNISFCNAEISANSATNYHKTGVFTRTIQSPVSMYQKESQYTPKMEAQNINSISQEDYVHA